MHTNTHTHIQKLSLSPSQCFLNEYHLYVFGACLILFLYIPGICWVHSRGVLLLLLLVKRENTHTHTPLHPSSSLSVHSLGFKPCSSFLRDTVCIRP